MADGWKGKTLLLYRVAAHGHSPVSLQYSTSSPFFFQLFHNNNNNNDDNNDHDNAKKIYINPCYVSQLQVHKKGGGEALPSSSSES